MADLQDVLETLADTVESILYPTLPTSDTDPSICGPVVSIYAGWPNPQDFDEDFAPINGVASDKVHVSVYPRVEESNTTRHIGRGKWMVQTKPLHTVTMSVVGNTVVIGGSVTPVAQNMGIGTGKNVSFVYQTLPNDTLQSAATALFNLIVESVPSATINGTTITFPSTVHDIVARIGSFATMVKETRRQTRRILITVWSGIARNRYVVAKAIDTAFSEYTFITMPDDFQARILYVNSYEFDESQKYLVYRRDLVYSVEYATTVTEKQWEIIFPQINVDAPDSRVITTVYA